MDITNTAVELALGRIFRLGSRATEPGDIHDYERCRSLILDMLAPIGSGIDVAPNYARDRMKGAAGD